MGTESKVCPNCKAKNNPALNECWKCDYSFLTRTKVEKIHKKEALNPTLIKKLIISVGILLILAAIMHFFRPIMDGSKNPVSLLIYFAPRIGVFIISLIAATKLERAGIFKEHAVALFVIAILYNPILTVINWMPVDIGCAIYFVFLFNKFRTMKSSEVNPHQKKA